MNARFGLSAAALFVLSLMGAAPARAGEWNVTFKVPFSATGLSSVVAMARLECQIKDEGGTVLGYGTADVPISGGAYAGPPIEIPVNVKGKINPTSWNCITARIFDVNDAHCVLAENPQYTFCKIKTGSLGGVPHSITSAQGKF